MLAFLESLRRVTQIGNDALDRVLHAVEFGEGGISPDRAVHEDATKPRVFRGVDHHWLADRGEQALGGAGVHAGIGAAGLEKFADRHFVIAAAFIAAGITREEIRCERHVCSSS